MTLLIALILLGYTDASFWMYALTVLVWIMHVFFHSSDR